MKGNWIQTRSGIKFSLDEPRPEMVNIGDIAYALARLPRYCGHTKGEPYSVAQHSYYVSQHCGAIHAMWGLLHDAPEAYVNDISRPVKQYMRHLAITGVSPFDDLEGRVTRAVCLKFNLPLEEPPIVKVADNNLLCTERRDLFDNTEDWHHRPANGFDELPFTIKPWKWRVAEASFLERFHQLGGKA